MVCGMIYLCELHTLGSQDFCFKDGENRGLSPIFYYFLRPDFQVIAEFVSALEYFQNQKIALTLCSARVRDVESTQLMFPPKSA